MAFFRNTCLLAALLAFAAVPGVCAPAVVKRPNLVLVVVDTLGAKHLGLYDESAGNHPALESIAAAGVLFEHCVSTSSWTKPAIASILTGLYPAKHGVLRLKATLPPERDTLAEILQRRGYQTHGVVSHTLIDAMYGFDQGFDQYTLVPLPEGAHRAVTSERVTPAALEQLGAAGGEKPFFLFAHFFDPHYNYREHDELDLTSWYKGSLKEGVGYAWLRRKFAGLSADDKRFVRSLYREEIAHVDHWIGLLLAGLKERALLDNTIVVITADHGEEFGEHGRIGHTWSLYNELVHVPLLIYFPQKIRPGRIARPVSLADILPTVLDLSGADFAAGAFDGISLAVSLSGAESAPTTSPRLLFSEVDYRAGNMRYVKGAAQGERFRMIKDYLAESTELYEWQADRTEQFPLTIDPSIPEIRMLSRELEIRAPTLKPKQPVAPEEVAESPEELRALKSLGYL